MNWRKKSKSDWGRLDLNSNKFSKWAISDFVEIIGGGTPKTSISEYWNGSIPWLSVKDFGNDDRYVFETEKTITNEGLNNSSTKLLQKDDIIISARGTVGELAMLPFPMAFNQSCYGIRPKDDSIDKTFLYYLLRNSVQLLRKNTHGSVFDTITRDTFKGIEVEVPSIEEQVKIAGILSSLDDKIAENKKINHHLVELARSFWQERFSSKQPNGKLGDIIELFDSKRVPLSANQREKMDKTYPYYGATSLMDYVDDYLFDGTYLLLGEDGTVIDKEGYPILQYVWGKFWVNNHAHIMVGNNGFTVESLFVLLKNTCVSSIVTGAVQLKINQANLKSVDVYIPQKEELDNFNSTIEPIFDQLRNLYDEIKSLTTLRDALLPKLMSGEISVAD